MNSLEWLKSVRENGQKGHIPPEPPEGAAPENTGNALIPPEPPRSSVHFIEKGNISEGTTLEQKEIYWEEKPKPGTSGGVGGNQGFYGGNDDSAHTGLGGNQGNSHGFAPEPVPEVPPLPYFMRDGTLVIPHNSDEKYHWWKGGMHVWEIREEVQRRMEAEVRNQKVG
jgi:hypothetical protein